MVSSQTRYCNTYNPSYAYPTNPSYMTDGNVATFASATIRGQYERCHFTTGQLFEIPAIATIRGIELTVQHYEGGSGDRTNVQLLYIGAPVGDDVNLTNRGSTYSDTVGGPTDLWGRSWYADDINTSGLSGFGVQVLFGGTSKASSSNVSKVAVTVYYDVAISCAETLVVREQRQVIGKNDSEWLWLIYEGWWPPVNEVGLDSLDADWDIARDAVSADSFSASRYIGAYLSGGYEVRRAPIIFPTGEIPDGHTVTAGLIMFRTIGVALTRGTRTFYIRRDPDNTHPATTPALVEFDRTLYTQTDGESDEFDITLPNFSPLKATLNSNGCASVATGSGAVTRWMLMADMDVDDVLPSTDDQCAVMLQAPNYTSFIPLYRQPACLQVYTTSGARVLTKVVAEAFSAVDQWSRTVRARRSFEDIITLSDSVVKRGGLCRAEALAVVDRLTKHLLRPVNEAISVAHEITVLGGTSIVSKLVEEALELIDSLSKKSMWKNIGETVGVTDSIWKRISIARAETLLVAETLVRTLVRRLVANFSVLDSLTNRTSGVVSKAVSETLAIAVELRKHAALVTADSLAFLDRLAKHARISRETQLLVQTGTPVKTLRRPIAQTVAISDRISKWLATHLAEQFVVSHAISTTVARSISETFSETLAFVDSHVRQFAKRNQQTLVVSADALVRTAGVVTKTLAEALALVDALSRKWDAVRLFEETLGVSDALVKGMRRTLVETMSMRSRAFPNGRIAYYDMETLRSGEIANIDEEDPTLTDGFLQGTTKPQPNPAGIIGGCYDFDGIDARVALGNSSELNPENELTIAMWVKAGRDRTSEATGWYEGFVDRASCYLFGWEGWTDGIGYGIYDETATWRSSGFLWPLVAGDWYFFAYSFDGRYLRGYADGVLRKTYDIGVHTIRQYAGETYLGYRGAFLQGSIDEVSFYKQALTDNEILRLYLGKVRPVSVAQTLSILDTMRKSHQFGLVESLVLTASLWKRYFSKRVSQSASFVATGRMTGAGRLLLEETLVISHAILRGLTRRLPEALVIAHAMSKDVTSRRSAALVLVDNLSRAMTKRLTMVVAFEDSIRKHHRHLEVTGVIFSHAMSKYGTKVVSETLVFEDRIAREIRMLLTQLLSFHDVLTINTVGLALKLAEAIRFSCEIPKSLFRRLLEIFGLVDTTTPAPPLVIEVGWLGSFPRPSPAAPLVFQLQREDGQPIADARVTAYVYAEGVLLSTVTMVEQSTAGVYRGVFPIKRTDPVGTYPVTIVAEKGIHHISTVTYEGYVNVYVEMSRSISFH